MDNFLIDKGDEFKRIHDNNLKIELSTNIVLNSEKTFSREPQKIKEIQENLKQTQVNKGLPFYVKVPYFVDCV